MDYDVILVEMLALLLPKLGVSSCGGIAKVPG